MNQVIDNLKVLSTMDGGIQTVVDITGVDLREVVRHAYALSKPVGKGFLQFVPGPIDEETVELYVNPDSKDPFFRPTDRIALSMDYVHGRAVKLNVFRVQDYMDAPDGMELFIHNSWFDHTEADLERLLTAILPGASPE